MKAARYQVTAALDGQEELEKARYQRFNLVLTDRNMPRMDGLTLKRLLLTLQEYVRTDSDADRRIKRRNEREGIRE